MKTLKIILLFAMITEIVIAVNIYLDLDFLETSLNHFLEIAETQKVSSEIMILNETILKTKHKLTEVLLALLFTSVVSFFVWHAANPAKEQE